MSEQAAGLGLGRRWAAGGHWGTWCTGQCIKDKCGQWQLLPIPHPPELHPHPHTRDRSSETHSNQYSVTRAREPAWRQDALARTVTQAVRTSKALAPRSHPLLSRTGTYHTDRQTDRAANSPWFLLFFHMSNKGWSCPILAPLALNVPRVLGP